MYSKIMAAAAALAIAAVAVSPAQARWHHGWRGGGGAIAGFAAGALIGGALASGPYYYGPRYAYGPGYYNDYAYSPGRSVAYCEQRFKSYDPGSGTYLGYDGDRHPCP